MARITLGQNISALKAQHNLANATGEVSRIYQKLSSGQRINTAADDAAGLAIADSLNAKTRIYSQGVRNLSDGLSLLAIADGATSALNDILIRLRELATQSANGTYSDKQRQALDQEAQALTKEYNRVARTTTFNGKALFNADSGPVQLQGGEGVSGIVSSGLGGGIGDGTFGAAQVFSVGLQPSSVAIGDFNGDGNTDMVSGNIGDSTLSVLYGRGDGTFSAMQSYASGVAVSITAADLNGDRITDIVTADSYGGTLSVHLGQSNGTFASRTTVTTPGDANWVTSADFNGDGLADLATANSASDAVNVYYGRGDGTFGSGQSYSVGDNTTSVAAADLNNDGVMDLMATNQADDTVSVLLGQRTGGFAAGLTYSTGTAPDQVIAVDVDSDGILDLAVADESSYTLSILKGNGDGTFRSRTAYSTGFTPRSLTAGDFNGDGNVDLAAANSTSSTLSVLLNRGDGTFIPKTDYSAGAGSSVPSFVATADFNNDGVLDLVEADRLSHSLRVLSGTRFDGISALQRFSLKTKSDALSAIPELDRYIQRMSAQRGTIGSFQSRVQVAVSNLSSSVIALQSARSRIMDVDVAGEASRLAAKQILQRTGAAVLAQANLQPELALKLLKS